MKYLLAKLLRMFRKNDNINYNNNNNTVKAIPDKRDLKLSLNEDIELPETLVLEVPPIRQQGHIGSCASHAAVRAMEIMSLKRKRYIEGSELYHYYNARKYVRKSYPKDSGMSIRDACKTTHKYGMAPESTWPYITRKFNVEPGKAAYWMSSLYQIRRYEQVLGFNAIKQSIVEGTPVIFGIYLDKDFYRLNYNNFIWKPYKRETKYGGHAQVIVGYKDDMVIVENSWGTRWGNNGRYMIRYEDLKKVGFDYYRMIYKEW